MLSRQEIFNKVVIHARKQRDTSLDTKGYCSYRGLANSRCFIGALITNKEYNKGMEGKSIDGLFNSEYCSNLNRCGLSIEDFKFLKELQNIHDLWQPCEWEKRFEHFAETFELDITNKGERLDV